MYAGSIPAEASIFFSELQQPRLARESATRVDHGAKQTRGLPPPLRYGPSGKLGSGNRPGLLNTFLDPGFHGWMRHHRLHIGLAAPLDR